MAENREKNSSISHVGTDPHAAANPAERRTADREEMHAISAIGLPLSLIEGWEYRIPPRRHAENIRSATKAFASALKMMANRNVERQKELLDRLEGTVTQKIETCTETEVLKNENNLLRRLLEARQKYSKGQSNADEGE